MEFMKESNKNPIRNSRFLKKFLLRLHKAFVWKFIPFLDFSSRSSYWDFSRRPEFLLLWITSSENSAGAPFGIPLEVPFRIPPRVMSGIPPQVSSENPPRVFSGPLWDSFRDANQSQNSSRSIFCNFSDFFSLGFTEKTFPGLILRLIQEFLQ